MTGVDEQPRREHEPGVDAFVDILSRYLRREVSTMIDVGARDCKEAIALARRFPSADVYAFECNPATLPSCERAVAHHPNVTLIPKAVSETEGSISFFQSDANPGASSVYRFSERYPDRGDRSDQRELQVDATTLERFMADHRLSTIDALWMDIQGAELSALRGLGDRLRDVGAIFTEVEFVRIYADQPLFWRLWAYLRRRGFLLYGFSYFSGYFGDAVFINREMLSGRDRLLLQAREVGGLSRSVLPLLGIGRYRDRLSGMLNRT